MYVHIHERNVKEYQPKSQKGDLSLQKKYNITTKGRFHQRQLTLTVG
jgi:hypothetical protein